MVNQARPVSHQPFRLVMQMQAPIVLSNFAPSLDGVLYSVLEAHLPNHNLSERLAVMDELLTCHASGVYHASAMRFGVSAAYENGKDRSRGLTVARYIRIDSMAKRKLLSEFYAPFGKLKGAPYPRVLVSGGPHKTRMTEREAYACPFVVFEGMGDGSRILELFEHYLMGVGYDADNAGAGAIGEIHLIPLDADISLALPDGTPNRCLPERLAKSLGVTGLSTHNRLCPPYYTGDRAPVIAPERVRIITNTAAMTA